MVCCCHHTGGGGATCLIMIDRISRTSSRFLIQSHATLGHGGHVRSSVTVRSTGVRSKHFPGSRLRGAAAAGIPLPPAEVRFYEENLRLPSPRLIMTAGSLLVAVRSSCLQTFRRPQLLLAVFPYKVSPSRVTQKSLWLPLAVSPRGHTCRTYPAFPGKQDVLPSHA